MAQMSKAARNEQCKLRATFFSNIGLAFVVGGQVAPIYALVGAVGGGTALPSLAALIGMSFGGFFMGFGLHEVALRGLRNLQD